MGDERWLTGALVAACPASGLPEGEAFRLERAVQEGDDWVVTGVQKRDKHGFRLRLSPREGGGTDGRLAVRHRD